jgi:hypothetical protein
VRADGDVLVLETLFFADEIRGPRPEISNLPGWVKLSHRELQMASQLIDSMSGPWQPSEYRDTYIDPGQRPHRGEEEQEEVPARRASTGRHQRDRPDAGAAGQPGRGKETASQEDGQHIEVDGQDRGRSEDGQRCAGEEDGCTESSGEEDSS